MPLNKTSACMLYRAIRNSAHMTDLENALHYLLYQEVGVVKHIYGDRLDALKSFMFILKNVSFICLFLLFCANVLFKLLN